MNWDAIGVIVESIGTIAVIASLVFVVYEVRSNTKALSRSEARETQRECTSTYYAVAGSPETSEIVLRGLSGMDKLDSVERYRFDLIVSGWLLAVEQAFEAADKNLYDEVNLVPHKSMAKGLICSAGGLEWWEETKIWFSPTFQKIVEELINDDTVKTRAEVANRDFKF